MESLKSAVAAVLLALAAPALAGTFDVTPPPPAPAAPVRDEEKPAQPKMEITVPGTTTEAQAKGKLRKDTHLARCVILPVMTDEEIDVCKAAYREQE